MADTAKQLADAEKNHNRLKKLGTKEATKEFGSYPKYIEALKETSLKLNDAKADHEDSASGEAKEPTKAKEPWEMTKAERGTPDANHASRGVFKTKKDAEANLAELMGKLNKSPQTKAILDQFGMDSSNTYQVVKSKKLSNRWGIAATHHHEIANAIQLGKSVPAEVLADYPDLVKKPEKKPEAKKEKVEEKEPSEMTPEEASRKLDVLLRAPQKETGKPRVSFATKTEEEAFRRGFQQGSKTPHGDPPLRRAGMSHPKDIKYFDAQREGWSHGAMAGREIEKLRNDINENKTVSATAVDTYDIKLPEGYIKGGGSYVREQSAPLKPEPVEEKPKPAAETGAKGKQVEAAIHKATGLPLNENGTVTVWHHTSASKAGAIRKTGLLVSDAEPDVYVTTHQKPDTGYGDTAVAISVNPEKLQLDDEFPNGRRDYSIKTGKPGGSIAVSVDKPATPPEDKPDKAAFKKTDTAYTEMQEAKKEYLDLDNLSEAEGIDKFGSYDEYADALKDAESKAKKTRTAHERHIIPARTPDKVAATPPKEPVAEVKEMKKKPKQQEFDLTDTPKAKEEKPVEAEVKEKPKEEKGIQLLPKEAKELYAIQAELKERMVRARGKEPDSPERKAVEEKEKEKSDKMVELGFSKPPKAQTRGGVGVLKERIVPLPPHGVIQEDGSVVPYQTRKPVQEGVTTASRAAEKKTAREALATQVKPKELPVVPSPVTPEKDLKAGEATGSKDAKTSATDQKTGDGVPPPEKATEPETELAPLTVNQSNQIYTASARADNSLEALNNLPNRHPDREEFYQRYIEDRNMLSDALVAADRDPLPKTGNLKVLKQDHGLPKEMLQGAEEHRKAQEAAHPPVVPAPVASVPAAPVPPVTPTVAPTVPAPAPVQRIEPTVTPPRIESIVGSKSPLPQTQPQPQAQVPAPVAPVVPAAPPAPQTQAPAPVAPAATVPAPAPQTALPAEAAPTPQPQVQPAPAGAAPVVPATPPAPAGAAPVAPAPWFPLGPGKGQVTWPPQPTAGVAPAPVAPSGRGSQAASQAAAASGAKPVDQGQFAPSKPQPQQQPEAPAPAPWFPFGQGNGQAPWPPQNDQAIPAPVPQPVPPAQPKPKPPFNPFQRIEDKVAPRTSRPKKQPETQPQPQQQQPGTKTQPVPVPVPVPGKPQQQGVPQQPMSRLEKVKKALASVGQGIGQAATNASQSVQRAATHGITKAVLAHLGVAALHGINYHKAIKNLGPKQPRKFNPGWHGFTTPVGKPEDEAKAAEQQKAAPEPKEAAEPKTSGKWERRDR